MWSSNQHSRKMDAPTKWKAICTSRLSKEKPQSREITSRKRRIAGRLSLELVIPLRILRHNLPGLRLQHTGPRHTPSARGSNRSPFPAAPNPASPAALSGHLSLTQGSQLRTVNGDSNRLRASAPALNLRPFLVDEQLGISTTENCRCRKADTAGKYPARRGLG